VLYQIYQNGYIRYAKWWEIEFSKKQKSKTSCVLIRVSSFNAYWLGKKEIILNNSIKHIQLLCYQQTPTVMQILANNSGILITLLILLLCISGMYVSIQLIKTKIKLKKTNLKYLSEKTAAAILRMEVKKNNNNTTNTVAV